MGGSLNTGYQRVSSSGVELLGPAAFLSQVTKAMLERALAEARLALCFLAQPGDPVMGAALRTRSATDLLALVTGADADGEALLAGQAEDAPLGRVLPRWRDRLGRSLPRPDWQPGRSADCGWWCRAMRSGLRNWMILAMPRRLTRSRHLSQSQFLMSLDRKDIPSAKLDLLRDLTSTAVRDCLVSGSEPLIGGLRLPDPNDRRVA
jgi:hypothetical protein